MHIIKSLYPQTPDIYEELAETVVHSHTLKKVTLDNCTVRP